MVSIFHQNLYIFFNFRLCLTSISWLVMIWQGFWNVKHPCRTLTQVLPLISSPSYYYAEQIRKIVLECSRLVGTDCSVPEDVLVGCFMNLGEKFENSWIAIFWSPKIWEKSLKCLFWRKIPFNRRASRFCVFERVWFPKGITVGTFRKKFQKIRVRHVFRLILPWK